jgi:hypothetical protein
VPGQDQHPRHLINLRRDIVRQELNGRFERGIYKLWAAAMKSPFWYAALSKVQKIDLRRRARKNDGWIRNMPIGASGWTQGPRHAGAGRRRASSTLEEAPSGGGLNARRGSCAGLVADALGSPAHATSAAALPRRSRSMVGSPMLPGAMPPGPRTSSTSKAAANRSRASATRAKMLWDDDFLYVAAELQEPHVVATLTRAQLHRIPRQRYSRSSLTRWRQPQLLRVRGQRLQHALRADAP